MRRPRAERVEGRVGTPDSLLAPRPGPPNVRVRDVGDPAWRGQELRKDWFRGQVALGVQPKEVQDKSPGLAIHRRWELKGSGECGVARSVVVPGIGKPEIAVGLPAKLEGPMIGPTSVP